MWRVLTTRTNGHCLGIISVVNIFVRFPYPIITLVPLSAQLPVSYLLLSYLFFFNELVLSCECVRRNSNILNFGATNK